MWIVNSLALAEVSFDIPSIASMLMTLFIAFFFIL